MDMIELISQIGLSAIFLYLYFQLRKEFQEARSEYQDVIKVKDKLNSSNQEKLVELVENNTTAMTELKSSVEANTKASDRLVQNVDFILRNNKD